MLRSRALIHLLVFPESLPFQIHSPLHQTFIDGFPVLGTKLVSR